MISNAFCSRLARQGSCEASLDLKVAKKFVRAGNWSIAPWCGNWANARQGRPAHSPREVAGRLAASLTSQKKERSPRQGSHSAHHSAPVVALIFGPRPSLLCRGHERKEASARPGTAPDQPGRLTSSWSGFRRDLGSPQNARSWAALQRLDIAQGRKVLLILDGPSGSGCVSRSTNLGNGEIDRRRPVERVRPAHAKQKLVLSEEALAKIRRFYNDDCNALQAVCGCGFGRAH